MGILSVLLIGKALEFSADIGFAANSDNRGLRIPGGYISYSYHKWGDCIGI